MKIDSLREFCYLSETLNFSTTAKHFFISQSVLSKHISGLEAELGVKLFLRTSHSVHLTPSGSMFVEKARSVIDAHDEALEAVERTKGDAGRVLSIGYLYESTRDYLLEACRLFTRKDPDTELVFYSLGVDSVLEALEQDDIDIAIAAQTGAYCPERYDHRPLFTDRFMGVVSKDSPLSDNEVLTLDDLRGADIIIRRPYSHDGIQSTSSEILDFFMQAGLGGRVHERLTDANSLAFMLQIDEMAVGLQPEHIADYYGPMMRFIPIEGFDMDVTISAFWKKGRTSPGLVAFVDCLETARR